MKSLYYPLDSQNLFFVFSHGCICPACLYGERLADVQTINQTFVLLTESKKAPGDANLSIEVKVSEKEKNSMIKCGRYLLYSGIIPLSRIVSITPRESINSIRIQIEANTAFLPARFLKRPDKKLNNGETVEQVEANTRIDEVSILKARYDKVLGGLALASIAGRNEGTLSLTFALYLAYFSPLVRDILVNNEVEFKSPFDSIAYKSICNYLKQGSIISKDTVRESALKDGQEIPRTGITKKEDFSGLTGAPYLLYILYNYKANDLDNDGNGTDKIDSLICKRFDGVKDKELAAYCYGRHRGYMVFRKAYSDVACKFKLDNYVDYIIIESVYKMVCKEQPDSSYYISFLKDVTTGINKPSDATIDNHFNVLGYLVKKVDPIQYPSAKWFCRFFSQPRSEQEITREYDKLVALLSQDRSKAEQQAALLTKLNDELKKATQQIQMYQEGVENDERIIEEKDEQIKGLASDNEKMRREIERLTAESDSNSITPEEDMPIEICEPATVHAVEIDRLKARIDELEEENFQFSKKIDELQKEGQEKAPDGYLDLGIDSQEQKKITEIRSLINRVLELYGKQSAVLAGYVRDKHFYANDRDDKKSLISKLILIEKGLLHD